MTVLITTLTAKQTAKSQLARNGARTVSTHIQTRTSRHPTKILTMASVLTTHKSRPGCLRTTNFLLVS